VRVVKWRFEFGLDKIELKGQFGSEDSAVGKATGYRLNGGSVGVVFPTGTKFFSSPRRPDRFWGPPSFIFNEYRGLFPQA
jgi:hypothetical protein